MYKELTNDELRSRIDDIDTKTTYLLQDIITHPGARVPLSPTVQQEILNDNYTLYVYDSVLNNMGVNTKDSSLAWRIEVRMMFVDFFANVQELHDLYAEYERRVMGTNF